MKGGPAIVIAGVAVAAVLLVGGAAAASDEGGDDMAGGKITNKKRLYWRTRQIPQLTEDQRLYIMLTAYGEGNFNPSAHNGSASERAASAKAAENNPAIVQRAIACGVSTDRLKSGSWTMFQLLAPYVSGTAFEIFGAGFCPFADPTASPSNLDLQIAIAIKHARDLQQYSGWQAHRTVGNLRLGWAAPSFMGFLSEHADRIERYRKHADAIGLGRAFIDRTLTMFPGNVAQIYAELHSKAEPTEDPLV